jgi:hypothetical protein
MRHGFTTERLMKLSRKIANDALRLRGATLQDRFDDLASRLQIVGLEAALRYDPERHHATYGSNGGEPFASYVSDVMANRVVDYFRSKAEGFGDRRYGNDNRVELSDDPDPADHNFDFEQMVGEREGARWQMAAEAQGCELSYFIVTSVSIATDSVLGSSTEPWRSPEPRYQRTPREAAEDTWGWITETAAA